MNRIKWSDLKSESLAKYGWHLGIWCSVLITATILLIVKIKWQVTTTSILNPQTWNESASLSGWSELKFATASQASQAKKIYIAMTITLAISVIAIITIIFALFIKIAFANENVKFIKVSDIVLKVMLYLGFIFFIIICTEAYFFSVLKTNIELQLPSS